MTNRLFFPRNVIAVSFVWYVFFVVITVIIIFIIMFLLISCRIGSLSPVEHHSCYHSMDQRRRFVYTSIFFCFLITRAFSIIYMILWFLVCCVVLICCCRCKNLVSRHYLLHSGSSRSLCAVVSSTISCFQVICFVSSSTWLFTYLRLKNQGTCPNCCLTTGLVFSKNFTLL